MATLENSDDHPFLTARHVDDLTDATRVLNRNVATLNDVVRRLTGAIERLIDRLPPSVEPGP